MGGELWLKQTRNISRFQDSNALHAIHMKPPALTRYQQMAARHGMKWNVNSILGHMNNDKKVEDGLIRFIMVRGIGKAFVKKGVETKNIRGTLERVISD